ncbi:mechanosensitive ion channel family protein [Sporosarcina ureilytica]|uniref:Mechanosensitive ion channel protein MscS n=1 Tax=Sporosarcina ureilytica TaxID=298596 RepID=A0A1D8JCD1_9BACL|nr:mechanosensitive ion channel family protein [Sporosarcina ureilytica]AOV06364.1 mechanosensitive ion channel protein MscS [Sporosarcina ureilytica]
MDYSKTVEEIERIILNQDTWILLGTRTLKIFFIVLIAIIVIRIGKAVIRRMFTFQIKTKIRPSERREQTLLKLLENSLTYVVYFSAMLAVLAEFNVDVTGILASAGVLGLAVGFGAQNLVRDVISGFFIIFEDQFSVGDYVQIGQALGTVKEIGLRTTKIAAYGGEVYIIPNGSITEVVNYSINNGLAIMDIRVAYETDIKKAESLIRDFIANLSDEYEELVAPPNLIGVQDLTASEIVFRVTAETVPVMQWAFSRKFRKDLKLFLDKNGIEIPYPKMVHISEQKGAN